MDDLQVFFVCGAPKSGTTWLQRMLDAHPEVCCSGEGHFIERLTAPLAEVVRTYNNYMRLVGERVYEGKPYYAPIDQPQFDDLARSFIMQRLTLRRAGPSVRCVGDKTPRYAQNLPQLRRLFPGARFLNIIRDPRDGAVSRIFHAARVGEPDALSPGSEVRGRMVELAAGDWAKSVEATDAFSAAEPAGMITLRYEDLLADAAGEARRAFGFLGVSTDEAVIGPLVEATSFAAQTGRKAGEEDRGSFLRKGVAGDWKDQLRGDEVARMEAACGALMARHGYTLAGT